ncbi:hypothetical protein [Candidatus Parabeggiatoa sp. HSG14]|uniref:hypothetical protein n=1 Tax=Candidatus Parabeggiatoa sp. HSG14 TaxID=3055593 RepID=UPI0025A7ADE5|nr:hypothetical protein [Thiotrichales bacterium HSG14]
MEINQEQYKFTSSKGHGIRKLIRWFIFSIIITLLPIILSALSLETMGKLDSLSQLIAHGELLLIATAISAAAVGELFISSSKLKILKVIVGGATITVLMIAASYFAEISTTYLSGVTFDTQQIDVIVETSLWIFGISVFLAGCCLLLSE